MKTGAISNSNITSEHTYDVQDMPLNIMISPNYNSNSWKKQPQQRVASQKEVGPGSPEFSEDKFSEIRPHKDGRRRQQMSHLPSDVGRNDAGNLTLGLNIDKSEANNMRTRKGGSEITSSVLATYRNTYQHDLPLQMSSEQRSFGVKS